MENKKAPDSTPAEQIVEKKRAKAADKAAAQANGQPQPRRLTQEEQQFVDQWCVGMRPIDQAMYILSLAKTVQKLAAEAYNRQRSGLVKPDGSKI